MKQEKTSSQNTLRKQKQNIIQISKLTQFLLIKKNNYETSPYKLYVRPVLNFWQENLQTGHWEILEIFLKKTKNAHWSSISVFQTVQNWAALLDMC